MKLPQSALIVLPIAIFYLMVSLLSINIPFADDYDTVLDFVNKFQDSTFKDKISLIFSQHNEHRLAALRVFTVLALHLTGKIDFRLFIIIGNISFIWLLIILFKSFSFPDKRLKLLYFTPVAFLLFQPQYREAILWCTPLLSLILVMCAAFLCLYLLTKQHPAYFMLSLCVAVLATFTNGNGMCVFLAGMYSLLCQKNKKRLIVWIACALMVFYAYAYGYVKPSHHPSVSEAAFIHPFTTLMYLLVLLGSCASVCSFNSVKLLLVLSLITGIAIVFCLFFLAKTGYHKKNPAVSSFCVFLLFSSLAQALARSGFGVEQALSSRYSMISVLFLILLYLSMIEIFIRKRNLGNYFRLFIILSLWYNITSYCLNLKEMFSFKRSLIEGLVQWKGNKTEFDSPDEERANSILLVSIERKLYEPPHAYLE